MSRSTSRRERRRRERYDRTCAKFGIPKEIAQRAWEAGARRLSWYAGRRETRS